MTTDAEMLSQRHFERKLGLSFDFSSLECINDVPPEFKQPATVYERQMIFYNYAGQVCLNGYVNFALSANGGNMWIRDSSRQDLYLRVNSIPHLTLVSKL
ncbi:hypothetical protein O9929_26975 [Vibrio lentus]|nr:hypothetical protein [Vibrio lentus]